MSWTLIHPAGRSESVSKAFGFQKESARWGGLGEGLPTQQANHGCYAQSPPKTPWRRKGRGRAPAQGSCFLLELEVWSHSMGGPQRET